MDRRRISVGPLGCRLPRQVPAFVALKNLFHGAQLQVPGAQVGVRPLLHAAQHGVVLDEERPCVQPPTCALRGNSQ
eukprot:scaffold85196_cov26-Tisochrysis_lutea.AAC.3